MPTARTFFLLITALFWNAVGYYVVRCPNNVVCAPTAATGDDKPAVSRAELAKHVTAEDCWVAIDGKVYSVGPFMDIHPGDSNLMRQYCGRDGSDPYAIKESGKEKGKPHSPRANEFLEEYFVGRLQDR